MDAPPVQYITTDDGVSIAYAISGTGPQTAVLLPFPFSHIQYVWDFYPAWMRGLRERFRLIQYDSRGWGLSSRRLSPKYSLSDDLNDIRAVVNAVNPEPVVLIGVALGSHLAIRYAQVLPERVRALVLVSSSLSMKAWPTGMWDVLPRESWDGFLELLSSRMNPDSQGERFRQLKATINYDDWVLAVPVMHSSDIETLLPKVSHPTLLLQPESNMMPFEQGMRVASKIPNARLVATPAGGLLGNPTQGLPAIDEFLSDIAQRPSAIVPKRPDDLSDREVEVLRLIAAGKSNPQIAEQLVISLNTVQRHVSNILAKTGAMNRTEAAGYARDHGLV